MTASKFCVLWTEKSYIPLLKVLMCGMNSRGAQGYDGIFILQYNYMKMALLFNKIALVTFPMATTVWNLNHNLNLCSAVGACVSHTFHCVQNWPKESDIIYGLKKSSILTPPKMTKK